MTVRSGATNIERPLDVDHMRRRHQGCLVGRRKPEAALFEG